MTVFEYDGKLLIVDCGVLFPEEEQPGVDLILPDFTPSGTGSTTSRRSCSPTATRTTSAPCRTCCAQKPDIPLVGSKLTLALVEAKLPEHRHPPYTLEVAEGDRRAARPVRVRVLRGQPLDPGRARGRHPHPAGLVLHTGDFKMDQLPLDGRLTDLAGFARLGEEGVDLLLVDSTNAEVPGFVPPERDIGRCWTVFGKARKRIIVACFASTCTASSRCWTRRTKHGRKVALSAARWSATWASPATSATCACRTACWSTSRGDDLPPSQVVLVSTGSQGEPMSALSRMANRRPPDPHRRGRHGRPGLVADPGQRERGLPGDQRPDPARRERRAQGQRQGARLRPRLGRRAAVLLQHLQAEQRDAGARRVAAPARQRRAGAPPASRRPGRARRGRRGRRPGRGQGQDRRARSRRVRVRRRLSSATSPRPR
jgi:hypothetical protein